MGCIPAVQNHIFGHHTGLQFSFQAEVHRLGNLDEEFACPHHETRVGVANARRKFVERSSHAGVRIRPKKDLVGPSVALLGKRSMANPGVPGTILSLHHPLR